MTDHVLADWLGKLFEEGQPPPTDEQLRLLALQLEISVQGAKLSNMATRARQLIAARPLDLAALRHLRDELRKTADAQSTTTPIRAEQLEGLLDETQQPDAVTEVGSMTMTMSSAQLAHLVDHTRTEPEPRRAHVIAAGRAGAPEDDDHFEDTTVVDAPLTTAPAAPEKQSETIELDVRDLAKLLREP